MEVLAIGADHAGVNLKRFLIENLKSVTWIDVGPSSTESVDYPDYAAKACAKITEGKASRAVLVCGSGIGMSIAANKIPGIRAAHVESSFTARLAGEHNRANVLCLGERVTAPHYALAMVEAWLQAEFGGKGAKDDVKSRHQKRIEKIHQLES